MMLHKNKNINLIIFNEQKEYYVLIQLFEESNAEVLI